MLDLTFRDMRAFGHHERVVPTIEGLLESFAVGQARFKLSSKSVSQWGSLGALPSNA